LSRRVCAAPVSIGCGFKESGHRMWRPIFKTLIFTVVVPGTVTIAVPRWLLLSRRPPDLPPIFRIPAWPLLLLGLAVYFWCAWDFAVAGRGTPAPIDPPKELVARGLYRYVRNPMYLGISMILVGEAFFHRSRMLLEYAAVVFGVFFLFVLAYEEPSLGRKFGSAYERYRQEVPRWIPAFRRVSKTQASPTKAV
jgi:protein-S-isoprenylcysteine O-methyltransferase Ste14